MSMIDAMLGMTTNTPRFGACFTRPSLASMRNTSRSVLREMPRLSLNDCSDRRSPGMNSPCVIFCRSASAMRSLRAWAGGVSGSEAGEVMRMGDSRGEGL